MICRLGEELKERATLGRLSLGAVSRTALGGWVEGAFSSECPVENAQDGATWAQRCAQGDIRDRASAPHIAW